MSLLLLLGGYAPAVSADVPVRPTVGIDLALGGSFRRTLVNAEFAVGFWPLSEVAIASQARDITRQGNHGTFTGTGITRGMSFDVPDGALGCTFAGTGAIVVPHNTGDAGGQYSLSLAGGSMDVVFLLMTTTNDATLRAILQKQETNSSGNGWHVGLQNGAIEFYLKVGGSVIFSFQRGAVADGTQHLVHCCYEPTDSRARIYIDGVQVGADVTATTLMAENTVDLRIGQFTDASGGFIGSLCSVLIGREGDSTLAARLAPTLTWTDVTADVRTATSIRLRYGIQGSGPLDFVASTGTLQFALDNSVLNSAGLLGYYSPDHANARAGFTMRVPVRYRLAYGGTTYYKFRGRILSIRPTPGQHGTRDVAITAGDWMNMAATLFISGVPVQIAETVDQVAGAVLDAASNPPVAVDLQPTGSTFPYALDNSRSEAVTLLQEFARIATSELTHIYIRGDTTRGGKFVVESRDTRQIETAFAATFSNTMTGLELGYADDVLVNAVRVVVYPRDVGAPGSTLVAIQAPQPVEAGATVELEVEFRDPTQRAARVGAATVIAPLSGTDYIANAVDDGSGTDLTSLVDVAAQLGANGIVFTITSRAPQTAWFTTLQARGTPLYDYDRVLATERDDDSVREFGERLITLEMPYQASVNEGRSAAQYLLGLYTSLVASVPSMTLNGNRNATLLTQVLALEPGDRIGLVETVTGLTTTAGDLTRGYYINAVELTVGEAEIVTATYTLSPSQQTPAWILDQVGASELDETTVLGF